MSETKTSDYPAQPTLAVGAVVFRNHQVLLVKRGKPPAQNMWAIPGGSVELGETLKQAAEREIFEETGIRIKAGEPVYSFEVIEHDETGKIQFHYYIIDLDCEFESGRITPGDDAADARWISEKDLNLIPVNPKTRELLRKKYNFG